MARKRKNPAFGKDVSQFDLRSFDPCGRVDVLVLNCLETFAKTKVPELLPLLDANKGVIHASLNEQLGPHVVDLSTLIKQAQPFAPLLALVASKFSSSDERVKA